MTQTTFPLGRYEGDTGLIVRVENDRVVLISDLTMHEMEILPKDLQLCTDMASGVDSLGKFEWGDLVNLDSETVGVIVRLERENFHVLNMHGESGFRERYRRRRPLPQPLFRQSGGVPPELVAEAPRAPADGRPGLVPQQLTPQGHGEGDRRSAFRLLRGDQASLPELRVPPFGRVHVKRQHLCLQDEASAAGRRQQNRPHRRHYHGDGVHVSEAEFSHASVQWYIFKK